MEEEKISAMIREAMAEQSSAFARAMDERFEQERLQRLPEMDRREEELLKREEALRARELRAEAKGLLVQRGLPETLAENVGCASREGMLAGVDDLERVFRREVEAQVAERLKGVPPMMSASAAPREPEQMDDETYYRMRENRR